MKAIKTIVATAVIVFAATTVAMAGVQHLGASTDDGVVAAQAQTAPAQQSAASGSVTLTAAQFAALVKTANGSGSGTRTHARHTAQKRDRAHMQQHTIPTRNASAGTQRAASHHTAVRSTATHHATTHHATRHHSTTQKTAHHGGTHDGGSHLGGCD